MAEAISPTKPAKTAKRAKADTLKALYDFLDDTLTKAEADHLKALYALLDDPLNDPLGDPLAAYRENMKGNPLGAWARRQWVGNAPAKSTLVTMADHMVQVDGEYRCYLSVAELDRLCDLRSARQLKRLEDRGLITRGKGRHPETGALCRYHVLHVDNGR